MKIRRVVGDIGGTSRLFSGSNRIVSGTMRKALRKWSISGTSGGNDLEASSAKQDSISVFYSPILDRCFSPPSTCSSSQSHLVERLSMEPPQLNFGRQLSLFSATAEALSFDESRLEYTEGRGSKKGSGTAQSHPVSSAVESSLSPWGRVLLLPFSTKSRTRRRKLGCLRCRRYWAH